MKVTVAELRALADKFFTFLEDFGHDPIEITNDFYWMIYTPHLYNPYERPTDFGLGQLMEEWPDLQKIITDEFYPNPVSLGWYAALLRDISDEVLQRGYRPLENDDARSDRA